MSVVESVFRGFEMFVLVYFSFLALLYALFGYLGMRSIITYARDLSKVALKDLMERDFYKPVSILVPAFNESAGIVANIRGMLELQYPQFEIIVANDGSTDRTLDVLVETFALMEVPQIYQHKVDCAPVRRVFRSVRHPNLVVVDKENGGKPDAVNAALNVARFPVICVVDADSLLDAEALVRATRLFAQDERVIGVGGTLRPLNGAVVRNGRVVDVRAPGTWSERLQVLEYARAFFASRAAWSRFNCLLCISGALGLFKRDAVIEVGGYWSQTVAEDMEIVIRLHRHYRRKKIPYRLVFVPDPICWTEVPPNFRALRRQRHGWQRGLWEVLWRHKRMLLNPRYGAMGMVGIPYQWFFEGGAALVEAFGYIYIVVSAMLGLLNVPFALLFLALAVLYGILLSEMAMGIETLLLSRYSRMQDRAVLLLAAVVEHLGIRQVMVFVRAVATFQVRRYRGRYWTETRVGITDEAAAQEDELVTV